MEFNQLVSSRRSIRAFKKGVVIGKEQIEEMIKCLQQAPSWKNSQTGRYYVALSAEKIQAVRNCLPEYNADNTQNAAAYIVTAYEKNRSGFEKDGNPTNELGNAWGAYDLGLQNSLLILKAKELGLDSLIMGLRDSEKLRQEFSIPESQEVAAVIALGLRDTDPEMPKRREIGQIVKYY